jgi:hypothetical protein
MSAMVRECERVKARPIGKITIPPFATWTVKMWHFGVDSLVTYRGQKFDITWQEGKEVLLHIYSKTANNKNRSKIRLESQGIREGIGLTRLQKGFISTKICASKHAVSPKRSHV